MTVVPVRIDWYPWHLAFEASRFELLGVAAIAFDAALIFAFWHARITLD